jgi:putative endonuclease
MKPIGTHNYFVYILTNYERKVLYIGITNDISRRLFEHKEDSLTNKKHFCGKYKCYYLIYFERFHDVNRAIQREKEIKKWRREKKEILINSTNKEWKFLNDNV